MFFTYIRMVGCNRTSLNGKNEIIIRPSTKTQMVLGTNGGGKSSLIELGFCPIPPEPHNFTKDGITRGSWEVTFTHKGRVYDLSAQYADKNSYSFIVDGGENLNKGRTISMMLELIKEHTGFTMELKNFLIGRTRFTSMGPKARQDWISKFSAVDFTFAFQMLAKFKKELSAHTEVAKYLQGKLNEAREKLMDPADVEQMRRKADELHETLELLMREPKHGERALDDQQLAANVDAALNRLSDFILHEYPNTQGVGSLDELVALRSEAEVGVHLLQGELKARGDRLADCEHKKQRVEQLGQFSPEELQSSMDVLKAQIDAIPAQVSEIHPSLLKNYHQVVNELRPVIGRLPAVRKSVQDVMVINNKMTERKVTLGRYQTVLDDINHQLDHINRCEVVACPKCHTEFKPGIEEGKQEELQARLAKGSKAVSEMTVELDVVEDELQSTSNIVAIYDELDDIRRRYQNACPGLFQYLDTFGWSKLGRGLNEKIGIFVRDCVWQADRDKKQQDYDILKSRFEVIKSEAGQTVQVIEDYTSALSEYNTVHATYQKANARKSRLDKALEGWREYIDLFERAELQYENVRKDILDYCNHQGDLMIEALIRNTKVTLGIHEAALSENQSCLDTVRELESQVEVSRIEEEARRKLVDAMSPKTGLIAEQIHQQMSAIIGTVNKMIQRVWTYPIYISPGEAGDTEVDYKLPITVDNIPRPDIAAGSSSIKDVVDQAFRLAAYYCMGLTDYPLYLDEIGSSFDEAHRYNLIPLIKDLTDDARFSQVLIISHTLDGQTSFPESQTIIPDDRNLKYPHPYNEHVEFA